MEKIFVEHPWIIVVVVLWTLPWKAAALWRAARRGHIGWFLTIVILNTLGILDILYILVFSRWGGEKKAVNSEEPQQPEQGEDEFPTYKANKSKFVSGTKGRSTIV
jgi:methionyl-tRNA synthetase